MKNGTSHSVVQISFGGFALACAAALTAACGAPGGRASPAIGPAAEALFAALSGQWVLDERESSLAVNVPSGADVEIRSFLVARRQGEPEQAVGDASDIEAWLANREKALEVLGRWPAMLALKVDGQLLVYAPAAGDGVTVPMSGESTTQLDGDHRLHTRVVWDDGRLALEHSVASQAWVREVLEVVDGRLIMTRTIRVAGEANARPPVVLIYGREEGES